MSPEAISAIEFGIGVTVLSIVTTLCLVVFQSYVIRKTRSLVVAADELHYRSDLLLNASVIVALILAGPALGLTWIDPLIGMGIALYIGWNAWHIGRQAYDQLMDREFDDDDRRRIVDVVMGHASVVRLHDLRTRRSGRDAFIQFHLELSPTLTLAEAHVISDQVEAKVLAVFPEAEVIIHQDPAGIDEDHPELAWQDAPDEIAASVK